MTRRWTIRAERPGEERASHRVTERAGARGIVLLGSPDLYSRFGFARGTPLRLEGPLAPYFQVLAFSDEIPAASVEFAPAFREARA